MKIGIVQVALSHGGAEQVGVMLANGLRQHGHYSFILTDLNEPIIYRVDNNVPVYDFVGNKTNSLFKWLKAIKNIRHTIKNEKPDAIIGIMGLCTLVTYIACLGINIPIVMTEHNSFERPKSAPMPLYLKIFKFWINRLYRHITVLTEADKKVIGKKLRNVEVMPNPLLLKPVEDIPPKENTVLAAGRVDSWHYKGFDLLLSAWKILMVSSFDSQLSKDKWWLKIAGNGKQVSFEYLMNLLPDGEWVYNNCDNQLKNWLWKSEKYHIEFLGFQKDMQSLYRKSAIFALSSRYEGFGLVLIEAMSQGCAPVICDYKGRQREIIGVPTKDLQNHNEDKNNPLEGISREAGLLCEIENVEELAKGLKKMISDNEYRKEIQRKSIERSKYYSVDNITTKWENYLASII